MTQMDGSSVAQTAYIAAGLDGEVCAINSSGTIYRFTGIDPESKAGMWEKVSTPGTKFIRVAVADADTKLAIAADSSAWNYDATEKAMVQILGQDGKPTSGYEEIAINGVDSMFVMMLDGGVRHSKELMGVKITEPVAPKPDQKTPAKATKEQRGVQKGEVAERSRAQLIGKAKARKDRRKAMKERQDAIIMKKATKMAKKIAKQARVKKQLSPEEIDERKAAGASKKAARATKRAAAKEVMIPGVAAEQAMPEVPMGSMPMAQEKIPTPPPLPAKLMAPAGGM